VPSTSGRTSQAPWGAAPTAGAEAGTPLVVETRFFDGLLTGLAASAIAGLVWWGVSVAIATSSPDFELWHLGSVLVGLIVGQGVLTGARRGGVVAGLLALVLSSLTVAISVYFIDRSLVIIGLEDAGRTTDISLWQGFGALTDLYRGWWEFDPTRPAMWLLAPIIAVLIAGWPGRRPVVG
jgi:hypothetical protein